MSGVNKVILIGNLGADPIVRYTQDNKAIANITIATSESYKDKDGKKQEQTEWHKVVFFNRLGEIAGEYLKKGSKIYVEGKMKTRKWDKDGVAQYTTEVVAESMQMLDGAGEKTTRERPATGKPYEKMQATTQEGFDDDVPF